MPARSLIHGDGCVQPLMLVECCLWRISHKHIARLHVLSTDTAGEAVLYGIHIYDDLYMD